MFVDTHGRPAFPKENGEAIDWETGTDGWWKEKLGGGEWGKLKPGCKINK